MSVHTSHSADPGRRCSQTSAGVDGPFAARRTTSVRLRGGPQRLHRGDPLIESLGPPGREAQATKRRY